MSKNQLKNYVYYQVVIKFILVVIPLFELSIYVFNYQCDYFHCFSFLSVHLLSCTPKDGTEYFFNRRPEEQYQLSKEQLSRWYTNLLNTATAQGVVKKVTTGPSLAPPKLPYFDGDAFPSFLETAIEAMEKQQNKDSKSVFSKKLLKRIKKKGIVSSFCKPDQYCI